MNSPFKYVMCVSVTLTVVLADPCSNYDTIDAWERSVANTIGTRCDSLLPEGWYKVTSGAGELMSTECIHGGARCGTGHTLWLDGIYPIDGETLNVTACSSNLDGTDCCSESYNIRIKNCTTFYVYYLVPVVGCPQAYCFGFELPCPAGQTSDTGFTPGCYLDPCQNCAFLPGEDKRSSSSIAQSEAILDDSELTDGWYRFSSYVGNDIVTSSPSLDRCGTNYPVWMNGGIPTEVATTVNRTCCLTGVLNDCESTIDIQVRNCGSFRVYYLVQLPTDNSAYCFGTLPLSTTVSSTATSDRSNKEHENDVIVWILVGIIVLFACICVAGLVIYKLTRKNTKHTTAISCSSLSSQPPSYKELEDKKKNSSVLDRNEGYVYRSH